MFAGCVNPTAAAQLKSQLSGRSTTLILDVTNEATIDAAYQEISLNHAENLWAIVNNAGVADTSIVHLTPLSVWHRTFDVNFFGAVAVTKRFIRTLLDTHMSPWRIDCLT